MDFGDLFEVSFIHSLIHPTNTEIRNELRAPGSPPSRGRVPSSTLALLTLTDRELTPVNTQYACTPH